MLQNFFYFQFCLFFLFLNSLFIKESWKNVLWFIKNIKQYYIDNNKNKRFLEHQISLLEWFLKDHVTMKIGV